MTMKTLGLFSYDTEVRGVTQVAGPTGIVYSIHSTCVDIEEVCDILTEVWQDAQQALIKSQQEKKTDA